jgi:hypothetical protein
MNLYEVTTGAVGESYVRAYVWAEDDQQARRLFIEKNPDMDGRARLTWNLLIDASRDKPFSTRLSDEGWRA